MSAVVGSVAAATLLVACSDSAESKVVACQTWDTAGQATQAWNDYLNDVLRARDAPDPTDEVLRSLTDAFEQAGVEAKAAFARAVEEDSAWDDVQEAGYRSFSDPTDDEARVVVEAACDRLES